MTFKDLFLGLTASCVLFCGSVRVLASVSGNLEAELLKDQAGVAIPASSLVLLVASTADATFSDINLSLQSGKSISIGSILGSDEVVVYHGNLNSTTPGFLNAVFSVDYADSNFNGLVVAGQRFALLWFPGLTTASVALPLNARFGFYDGGIATAANQADADSSGTNGGSAWILPPDGTSFSTPNFFTKDSPQVGSAAANQSAAGLALGSVIPEPSAGLLGLLGCLGFLGFHRQRA